MQPVINAPEIATAREQQLFNGKNFHVFIYNKTEYQRTASARLL